MIGMKTETKKKKSIDAVVLLLLVAIIFSGFLSVKCHIDSYERNFELSNMKEEYEDLKNEGERLRIEVSKETNYIAIEAYVQEMLNMEKIRPHQIEYIRKDAESYIELLNDGENESMLTRIAKAFSVITEYFNET